jgi:hypothetical protein
VVSHYFYVDLDYAFDLRCQAHRAHFGAFWSEVVADEVTTTDAIAGRAAHGSTESSA